MRGKSYSLNTPTLGVASNGREGRRLVTLSALCACSGKKSIIKLAVILVAAIASVADIGHAQTFQKTKLLNEKSKEVAVDLCFDGQNKLLTAKPRKSTVVVVPYGSIDKLSYEQAAHHRVRDGAGAMSVGCIDNPALLLTCPVSLGAGAVLMLTKGKNHWFYVEYRQDGTTKNLTFRLSKSEYEQVLKTAKEQTGKDVEVLASRKGKSPNQKNPTPPRK